MVNSYDKVAIGRTHVPEINYGYGVSIGWKGFDVSIFMQGVANVTNFMDGSPINGFENANLFLSGVYEDVALNRWTVENPNPNAKYPRMSSYINQNNKQWICFMSVRGSKRLMTIKLLPMVFIRCVLPWSAGV